MDVFNSNGDNYENAWDLHPAAETVVAVPQTVAEEGRDVRAGVLHYLNAHGLAHGSLRLTSRLPCNT